MIDDSYISNKDIFVKTDINVINISSNIEVIRTKCLHRINSDNAVFYKHNHSVRLSCNNNTYLAKNAK